MKSNYRRAFMVFGCAFYAILSEKNPPLPRPPGFGAATVKRLVESFNDALMPWIRSKTPVYRTRLSSSTSVEPSIWLIINSIVVASAGQESVVEPPVFLEARNKDFINRFFPLVTPTSIGGSIPCLKFASLGWPGYDFDRILPPQLSVSTPITPAVIAVPFDHSAPQVLSPSVSLNRFNQQLHPDFQHANYQSVFFDGTTHCPLPPLLPVGGIAVHFPGCRIQTYATIEPGLFRFTDSAMSILAAINAIDIFVEGSVRVHYPANTIPHFHTNCAAVIGIVTNAPLKKGAPKIDSQLCDQLRASLSVIGRSVWELTSGQNSRQNIINSKFQKAWSNLTSYHSKNAAISNPSPNGLYPAGIG